MTLMNIGLFDRALRIIFGLVLLGWALGFMPGTQSAWGWIGIVPLVTALFGYCPAYSLIGLRTCAKHA